MCLNSIIKNKIEICLKNFRLNYRVLSAIPIMPILLTATFIVICVYTGKRDIVFPTIVQRLIIGIWLGGSFFTCVLPTFLIRREGFCAGNGEAISAGRLENR